MNKTMVGYIVLLLTSLLLVSYNYINHIVHPKTDSIIGSWDYTRFSKITIDSSTTPFTASSFDTSFSPHSKNSYQFKKNGNVVYTDYTSKPYRIIKGSYYLINSPYTANAGNIIIQFSLGIADTVHFWNDSLELVFPQVTSHSHFFKQEIKYYTPSK